VATLDRSEFFLEFTLIVPGGVLPGDNDVGVPLDGVLFDDPGVLLSELRSSFRIAGIFNGAEVEIGDTVDSSPLNFSFSCSALTSFCFCCRNWKTFPDLTLVLEGDQLPGGFSFSSSSSRLFDSENDCKKAFFFVIYEGT